MTREQKIEAIRKKAIEANPEIQTTICPACDKPSAKLKGYCGCGGFLSNPIDAREVRLADVLLAMNHRQLDMAVQDFGAFMQYRDNGEADGAIEWCEIFGSKRFYWNLRADDVTLQSDETINFIHEILCQK